MSGIFAFFDWVRSQFKVLPYPAQDCSGKTVIVTGANVGLGLETARHFARLNARRVILACRSTEKGEAAKRDIEASLASSAGGARPEGKAGAADDGPSKPTIVEVWQLDLSSYESVKEFAARAERELDRLDYLIDNASVAIGNWQMAEGHELSMTVNVYSTFLLTLLLVPRMRETATRFNTLPHIVVVSSDAATWTHFNEVNAPDIFAAYDANQDLNDRYAATKLLQIIGARCLAAALATSGKSNSTDSVDSRTAILVNTLSPGLCDTTLWRYAPGIVQLILNGFVLVLGRSAEVGARTIMAAAFAPPAENGKYMIDCVGVEDPKVMRGEEGEEKCRRTWEQLLDLLEAVVPGAALGLR